MAEESDLLWVLYETLEGIPQGSVLRPGLWNTSYGRRINIFAAVIAGHTVELSQSSLGILMRHISGVMNAHDFSLGCLNQRLSNLGYHSIRR